MAINLDPNVHVHRNLSQKKINQSKEKMNKYNQLYDKEFISLINNLNESIKEYYKVSTSNINEANSFISYYKQQGNAIQSFIDEIIKTNSNKRVNEVFEQIPKIDDIMSQLQMNTNSNKKNLDLFFQDAKKLFQKMKTKRSEKLLEISKYNNNNHVNRFNKQGLNDSFSKSLDIIRSNQAKDGLFNYNMNNNNNSKDHLIRINPNINQKRINTNLSQINNIYTKILQLLNNLNEFNFIIKNIDLDASNKYNNLQNNIRNELDIFMNLVKNNFSSKIKMVNSIKNFNNVKYDINAGNIRSKNISIKFSEEFERLKHINQINEKKIKELNNELNTYRNNLNNFGSLDYDKDKLIRELEIKNNNLNLKLIKAEQQNREKNNIIMNLQNNSPNNINNLINNNNNDLNINLNSVIKQKDNQILTLQQQLYVYQNNETLLNSQINDLNNKINLKINQYESQITILSNKNSSLTKVITNKNKDILKFQNENNEKKKELERLKKAINSQRFSNSNKNTIEEPQEAIKGLQNYINNNQYDNQIKDLSQNNNNGINANNIGNNNLVLQKEIEMLISEIKMKENEFNQEREIMINQNSLNEQKINILNTQNLEQKMQIDKLNKEIINYQRKEKVNEEKNNKYAKQIEEMNNKIIYTNQIIEQKEKIIRQLNEKNIGQISSDINNNNTNLDLKKDNNEMLKMKLTDMELENEKLKKENEELKALNNKNIILNNKITNVNSIQELNNTGNNEFESKIKELSLENQKYKESLQTTKESIAKLESDINKKNEELEGLKTFIFKLQSQLEQNDDNRLRKGNKNEQKKQENLINIKKRYNDNLCLTDQNRKDKKNGNIKNKFFEAPKDPNTKIDNLLNKLNDKEKEIKTLQNKNKELQYQLEVKQVEKDLSGYRTEDVNFSGYEEEFDLKKMINGARDKNRSEDINIDYPGVQGIKDKYKELLQNMYLLEEQVKILICNINCNNKIKPQITQICQLMRIRPENIQLIIAGKDKKNALGLTL